MKWNLLTQLFVLLIFTTGKSQGISMPQTPQPTSLQSQVPIGMNPRNTVPAPISIPPQHLRTPDSHRYPRNQAQDLIDEATRDIQSQTIQYDLPDQSHLPETHLFRKAYQQIHEMLDGKQPLSLKKAVFEVENAWYGGLLNYESFCTEIAMMIDMIQTALQQEGHSLQNDLAKKWMLHHFMSDTFRLKNEKQQVTFTHLPYEYDFEDPFGKKDYCQFFVTKLMRTRKGQCRSLPLLYLILAEELGVKAWLAYSPQHSYVKLQDEKQNWYNLELTNGHYSADSWILGSSFIKAEALKNQLYMDTLSKKALIAGTLNELGKGYAQKWGYDPFVVQCAETTLKQHPNDVFAMQLKSDCATMRFRYVLQQLNYPPKNQIHRYPKAQQILQEMYTIYDAIDQTGYEAMPEDLYKAWLQSFNDQKGKQPILMIKP
jgi:hypothetical protein